MKTDYNDASKEVFSSVKFGQMKGFGRMKVVEKELP